MYFDNERANKLRVHLEDDNEVNFNKNEDNVPIVAEPPNKVPDVYNKTQGIPAAPDPTLRTRSGRRVQTPTFLQSDIDKGNEMNALVKTNINNAFMHVSLENNTVDKIFTVGAGIGGGFTHTSELKPMIYIEAMNKDPVGWQKAIDKEHERMEKDNMWKAVKKKDVPENAKVLSTVWAM